MIPLLAWQDRVHRGEPRTAGARCRGMGRPSHPCAKGGEGEHHTAVHEGGVTITRDPDGWVFSKPDGQTCQPWVSDDNLARHLDFALRKRQQAHLDQLAAVDSFQHSDARIIRPRWAGEVFDLHACVQALFTIKLPELPQQDQQAA